MTKFNVGDRVVALRNDIDVTMGNTYTVADTQYATDYEVVIIDDVGDMNGMREIDLELAEEYEDETVKQLRREIDEVKSELGVLAGQVASLIAEDAEPKPVFEEGDYVRFIVPYVDFEGDVAIDGQYGKIVSYVYNPVVIMESGTKVLIDRAEVEVSDVIEHAYETDKSNESETKDSKTVVVEYDPIEWSDIEPGDVLICTEDGLDVSRGRIYQIESVVLGEAVFTDDVGDTHYWRKPDRAGINDNVSAFRQRPVY